ncbi:unnamed protein product [Dracunculus medinensis]|uniref:Integrator complex subunit 7 n=1 Tax=Dracunculus medinensis TaxID=318479 RepID=A0A0N4UIC0_DRAME|nr:unnamed protein product [Dracunculus medinensis]
MATIVSVSSLFRSNPFPFFVNAAVLRLCETFRDECNELRLCIVRVMGECKSELQLVFSCDEVARRLLKVSHSNDVLARSLTLHMLAKLAVVTAENKQVHHLIITSLDSDEQQEQLASIIASKEYMRVSKSFSQTIFEKLCTRLLSTALSSTMKVRLVDLFAEITADIEIIMQIFELGERILQTACNKRLTIALITSLTTLACSCRYGVPKLLNLLLNRLNTTYDPVFCVVILRSVQRLSSAVHMFSSSQIKELCDFGEVIKHHIVREAWLMTLIRLSIQNIKKVNDVIDEFYGSWSFLLSSENISIRLGAMHLFVNLYLRLLTSNVALLLQSAFIIGINEKKFINSEKFYRLLTVFLRQRSSIDYVDSLIEALLDVVKSSDHFYILQLLISTAEAHPYLYPYLSKWARSQLNNEILQLFAYLVYAPFEDVANLPANHLNHWGQDCWKLYLIGRTAMRNGHGKRIALPIFELIEKEVIFLGMEGDGLCALKETQLHFFFAEKYLENILSFLLVVRRVLIVRNITIGLCKDLPTYMADRLIIELRICSNLLIACRDKWAKLYRRCFDADAETLATIELYCSLCAVLSTGLSLFCEEQPLSIINVPSMKRGSVSNNRLRSALVWAKNQLEKFEKIAFKHRCTYELNIMTQPPSQTDITVNITRNQKLSVSIEGAIESSQSSTIDTIILKSTAKFSKGSTNQDFSQTQSVIPREDKFFNAQFLIAIPQSCTIEFSVDFLDKAKRYWETDTKAELRLTV